VFRTKVDPLFLGKEKGGRPPIHSSEGKRKGQRSLTHPSTSLFLLQRRRGNAIRLRVVRILSTSSSHPRGNQPPTPEPVRGRCQLLSAGGVDGKNTRTYYHQRENQRTKPSCAKPGTRRTARTGKNNKTGLLRRGAEKGDNHQHRPFMSLTLSHKGGDRGEQTIFSLRAAGRDIIDPQYPVTRRRTPAFSMVEIGGKEGATRGIGPITLFTTQEGRKTLFHKRPGETLARPA